MNDEDFSCEEVATIWSDGNEGVAMKQLTSYTDQVILTIHCVLEISEGGFGTNFADARMTAQTLLKRAQESRCTRDRL